MSEVSQLQVSYSRETDWGTTVAGNPFLELPVTGGGMPHGQDEVRSATIRDDAQLADSKRVGLLPTAQYPFEFAAETYDPFLRDAIRSTNDWSTAVNIAGTDIAAESSGNQLTSTSTDLSENVAIGQWVYVASTDNTGWGKVTAASTYVLTLAGITLTDDVAGDSVTIKGAYIWNGTGKGSYSIQQCYGDLTNKFHILTGARVNTFTMDQTPGGIITCSMAFDGKQRAQAAAGGGTGVITAAAANDVRTEVDGFDSVWIDTAIISYDVYGLSLNVALPNIPRKALGSLPRTSINQGALNVSGKIRFLLDDDTWAYDGDYEDFTKFGLAFSLNMGSSDRYLIELPQCAYSDEPNTIGNADSDMELDLSFMSEPGGTFGATSDEKTICINRVV